LQYLKWCYKLAEQWQPNFEMFETPDRYDPSYDAGDHGVASEAHCSTFKCVLSSQFGNGKYTGELKLMATTSGLFERYHGTDLGIWLKDGETSYYEFLSKATGLRA
jgi:hypothetical protein